MTCILASILLGLGLFLAVAFVSGNNLSACVGTAIGGRVINPRTGMALGAAGFVVGIMCQGPAMTHTVSAIFPLSDTLIISKALFVIVFIFLLANIVRIPLPLTMSLVGLLVGVATAHHLPMQVDFLATVIAVWFAAPALALVLAFYSVRLLDRMRPLDFWRRIAVYKVVIVAFAFLNSYVLGANTLGLLVAMSGFSYLTITIGILGIFVGSFFLSAGPIRRLGEDLFSLRYSNALVALIMSTFLVEFATFFSVPLSNTQTLSASVLGEGLSYRHKFISAWPFTIIIVGWIIAPLLSFLLGFLL
ncbi:MAG: inorganic phosphate transporter [Candidatus Bathyarchaeia archaeon]